MMKGKILLVILTVFGLGGCTMFQPQVIAASDEQVTVEYDTTFLSFTHTLPVSDQACQGYGRKALFISRQGDWVKLAFFDCVMPPPDAAPIYERVLPDPDQPKVPGQPTPST